MLAFLKAAAIYLHYRRTHREHLLNKLEMNSHKSCELTDNSSIASTSFPSETEITEVLDKSTASINQNGNDIQNGTNNNQNGTNNQTGTNSNQNGTSNNQNGMDNIQNGTNSSSSHNVLPKDAHVEQTQDDMAKEEEGDSAFNINRKIFVGNISYRIKSRKLTKFFWKFGPVEQCYIVKDHIKGWSRGFVDAYNSRNIVGKSIAFVTFKDVKSMRKALEATEDELVLDERQMRVKPAELSNKTTFWKRLDSSSENEDDWDPTNQSEQTTQSHDQSRNQSEISSGAHINDLFDDLLIHIFTMMSFKERVGVERVCRRWKNVVQASWVSYRSLSFHNFFKKFGSGLTDKNLNSALQRCGQNLECLDLSGSPNLLTDFSMNVIGNYCPGLKELDISSVKITDRSLQNLVSKCTRLKRITLKRSLHITEKNGVIPLLENIPDLEHIDLSENYQIKAKCFRVARPNLRSVILSECVLLNDEGFSHLANNCPHLEELNLKRCKQLTIQSLMLIVQNFGALKILVISQINCANPDLAINGVLNLPNLEYFDASYNFGFDDTCLCCIVQNCPKLRYLDICACSEVTNIGLASLASLHLHTLNISLLTRPSSMYDDVVKVARAGTLRKFIAKGSPFLVDPYLMEIIASSPHLEYLDVSDCLNITNEFFKVFRNGVADESKPMELYIGGTSVDWAGEDLDWVRGFSHFKVYMMGSRFHDGPLMMEEIDDQSDEEYEPHHPISDYLPEGPVEAYDDWDEQYDEYDDFLDNDDPLETERWDMS